MSNIRILSGTRVFDRLLSVGIATLLDKVGTVGEIAFGDLALGTRNEWSPSSPREKMFGFGIVPLSGTSDVVAPGLTRPEIQVKIL